MNTITAAICTLPGDSERRPTATVNRIDATGTGQYTTTRRLHRVFTLIDNGEPGKNDEAGFVVCLTTSQP